MSHSVLAEVAPLVEDWRNGVGAQGVAVALCDDEPGCPCGPVLESGESFYTVCPSPVDCPLAVLRKASALLQVGTSSEGLCRCFGCSVLDGQRTLVVRAYFGEVRDGTGEWLERVDRSVGPLLRTVRERIEVNESSARRRERGLERVPSTNDLLSTELYIYARELSSKHDQVRSLEKVVRSISTQAENEVRQMTQAQENEREWLALELHDRVAQTLASVFQQLQGIEGLSRNSPQAQRAAITGSKLCREAIREVRSLMNDLRPAILDELGLSVRS